MEDPKQIVMYDSDEAAHLMQPAKGWVSRLGGFFGGDERAARYNGCTHWKCERCGAPVEKHWLKCEECRDHEDLNRYNAKPKKEWDGKSLLYSHLTNQYYLSPDEAEDSHDGEYTIDELMLVICDPVHARRLDSGYWEDQLPDDEDLPDWLQSAVDDFNRAIEVKPEISWEPGKYALLLEEKST